MGGVGWLSMADVCVAPYGCVGVEDGVDMLWEYKVKC